MRQLPLFDVDRRDSSEQGRLARRKWLAKQRSLRYRRARQFAAPTYDDPNWEIGTLPRKGER
jgi:hypothetical protein